jgi:hypothetical protein
MGFVGEHPFFGPAASLAFLSADFFHAGSLCRDPAGLELFNFIQQQPSGNVSIETLLARRLALHLEAGGSVEQHDAR